MKGREFKEIRDQLGLTQEELSQVLCLSGKQSVGNIETDFRKPGKLIAVLMRAFVELPKRQSEELRKLLVSLARKESTFKVRKP